MNHIKGLREKTKHLAKSLLARLSKTGKLLSTGKRQITASILSLVMVFTMVPALSLTSFAATDTPLTFTAQTASSSVTLGYKSGDNVAYKKNDGAWTSYTKGTAITLENVGDTVSFKGTNVATDFMNHFTMSGTIAASGDVTSLTNGVGGDVALTNNCYYRMFDSCDSLTTAPALPSTTLADGCYYCMFTYCSGLIEAPVLPANTLKNSCYYEMFKNCESLPTPPALPATELADYCYFSMFYGCYSLTTVPALPATTLKVFCYDEMFYACGSLKISNTETGVYTKEWRIPTTGDATTADGWNHYMLDGTGGTFTGEPAENTTYYIAEPNYLTFTAQVDGSSVTLNYESGDNVEYKMNDGEWTACTSGTSIPLANTGDTVSVRGTNITTHRFNHFAMTGSLAASGDITSLTNRFGGDTTLTDRCYADMFRDCTALTAAPTLPATTLAEDCYSGMFNGCTNLTEAPALPATELAVGCYSSMFSACTGLTTPPELPATTLPDACYSTMFYGCTGIKISATKTGAYTKAWRIPTTGDAAAPPPYWNNGMILHTGGTYTSDPAVNTIYYLYEDKTAPVITGIEDGITYCVTAEFTVTDADLATVTAKGTALTAAYGTYTLTEVGTYDVVATDVAGNSATISSVTLNANHTLGATWSSDDTNHWHVCSVCGAKEDSAAHTSNADDGDCTTPILCSECGAVTTAAASDHDFTRKVIDAKHLKSAATCTSQAVYYYTCSRCDEISESETFTNGEALGHSFTTYVSDSNATYLANGTETATCDRCDETDTRTVAGTKLIDTTAPTGEIKIRNNSFKSFINSITFGLFFKDSQAVTIIGSDDGIGVDKIFYFKSESALEKASVEALSADKWTEGTSLTLSPDWQGVVYAKITDKSGNTLYISSDWLVFDATSPVISGVTDGRKYCITATVVVTEENLDSVTLDGESITLTEGKFTVSAKAGAQTIVVTDKMGNEATATITVYAEHTWNAGVVTKEPTVTEKGVKTYTCTICNETKTEEIDKLAPNITDGNNGSYQQGDKGGLTFKSNAALSDFISVSVDGTVIDQANYTLKEGSTIVTLTDSYLATLSVGKHTLAVNSTSGTSSIEFTIKAKATDPTKPGNTPAPTTSPSTGDTNNVVLWIALLFISGGALTALGITNKHKKTSNK